MAALMTPEERARARFVDLARAAGHYESFYLKASHPTQPLAVWIRYTVHKRPGASLTGSVWFTLFDAAADGPRASKTTVAAEAVAAEAGEYIRIGESRFAPGRVEGVAASECCDAAWGLDFAPGEPAYRHLPRDWLYRAPLPRTKLESPHPATRFSGRLAVDGREIEVEDWPGMVGHNWGAQHAERWIWMHGSRLSGHGEDAWLDAALGRIKLGPLITPWIANARLALDGAYHRLGGPERLLATEVGETPRGCDFLLPGRDIAVQGHVTAPADGLVGWVYTDPDGSEHNTVHSSIARMRLLVRRPGRPDVELETESSATYELGMRERDHGVELQPFGDG